MRFSVLSIPLLVFLCFFLFTRVYHKRCTYDSFLAEAAGFTYERFEPLKVSDVEFNLEGYIIPHSSPRSELSVAKMIENLKVSVITGKKMYVLLDGVFIEKGKSYNGIKFVGIDGREVIFEIDGKIYRKRF